MHHIDLAAFVMHLAHARLFDRGWKQSGGHALPLSGLEPRTSLTRLGGLEAVRYLNYIREDMAGQEVSVLPADAAPPWLQRAEALGWQSSDFSGKLDLYWEISLFQNVTGWCRLLKCHAAQREHTQGPPGFFLFRLKKERATVTFLFYPLRFTF